MSEAERVDEGPDHAAESDQCPDLSDPRSPQILQYALEGYTWDQIARELKIHVRTLLRIRERDSLDALIKQVTRDDGEATIRAYVTMRRKAFMTMSRLMDDPNPRVRLSAANMALGFVATKDGAVPIEGEESAPAARPSIEGFSRAELSAKAAELRKKLGSGGSQSGRR